MGVGVMILFLFPPLAKRGDWRDVQTNEKIPSGIANVFDRSFFGLIPSHGWIGRAHQTSELTPACKLTIGDQGPYICQEFTWQVQWLTLLTELSGLLVLSVGWIPVKLWLGRQRPRGRADIPGRFSRSPSAPAP
jgi:hypothetical protein